MDEHTKRRNQRKLLRHVVSENCTDPDCEIHNIEVAVEEQVITAADAAFWLAGYQRAMKVAHEGDTGDEVANHFDEILGHIKLKGRF